jgi:hypothetical protein
MSLVINKEEKESKLPKYINWKIILVIGIVILVISLVMLNFFKQYLVTNGFEKGFVNIFDSVKLILVLNICIGIFTITNYYYRITNKGEVGSKGFQGKVGKRGKDKQCDIFSEKVHFFKKEVVPEDLQENIKLESNINVLSMKKPKAGWYTVFRDVYNKDNKKIRRPNMFNKILGSPECVDEKSCNLLKPINPPNNKAINGAIINHNDKDGSINAIQFTYDDNYIPNRNKDNTKLLSLENMCNSIYRPFLSEQERKNKLEKYLVDINLNNNPLKFKCFSIEELKSLFKIIKIRGSFIYLGCMVDNFFYEHNIINIIFIKNCKDGKYKLYGTTIRDINNKPLFKKDKYPLVKCKPCRFDKLMNKFTSVCNKNLSKDQCLSLGCLYGYENNKCGHIQNRDKCYEQNCIYNNGICRPKTYCHDGKMGNNNDLSGKNADFKCPPGSAIYRIETLNSMSKKNNPGKLKGIRFYCRDIKTGKHVRVYDKYNNLKDYASYGISHEYDNDDPKFEEYKLDNIQCDIHMDKDIDDKEGYKMGRPSFFSNVSGLYNNDNINALGFHSCVYYRDN